MSTFTSATGDPVALRSVAATLRREADVVASTGTQAHSHVSAMAYAGPAADRLREQICGMSCSVRESTATLLEIATWLDTLAAAAEAEIAARRALALLS